MRSELTPTMADLARKKRVRGGHKASVTKILRKAEDIMAADPPDVEGLAQIKMSLQEKLTVLKGLDAEILELVESEDAVTEEIEQADVFKQDMYAVLVKIERLSSKGPTPTPPEPSRSAPRTDPPSSAASKVKLPKLTIQPFNGEPTNWMTFWDSYKTAVDDNPALTEIEKFAYLRSLLQGLALEAISGLALSAANYKQAVDILHKRFGNKRVIISKHMDVLMNLEPVHSDHHLRDLRKLYDGTESHIRSLKSLGIEADTYGTLLSPVLLTKLPPDLRLIVSRKVSDSNLDIDALLETFELELTARERANPQRTPPSKRSQDRRTPPTASTLFSSPRESNAEPQCSYCQQTHSSSSCTTVVDVAARKGTLKSSGRCFNCLRKGHISRNCKSSSRCRKCKRKHHTSICEAEGGQTQPTSLATPSGSDLSPGAPPFRPSQTTTNICSSHSQVVFLQTARAVIRNPTDTGTSIEVRLLFDSGSQRSYLSERARDLLRLDASGEHSLSIATFGSLRSNKKVCPIVNVHLCLKEYPSMPLSLYVVPSICKPLVGQPIDACVENYPHLLGLELADFSNTEASLPVDLLIGSDYYWELVTGQVCRGANGPTVIHTKLGWVLSGPSSHSDPERSATSLSVTHVLHTNDSEPPCALDDQLKAFWDLESFGVTVTDHSVLDEFQDKIHFTGERYEVSLPWKNPHQTLPDNYELCQRRFQGLTRRLRQNPEVLKEYDSIIQNQIRQGIVEFVDTKSKDTDGSVRETPERIHYLPHHAVIRCDKDTTKIRVVYDASARCGGPSLNDCLHTGPKFHQRMFDLLLRFRTHRVALTADIEKAFLMIQMAEEDRDVLRFLWVDDITKEQPKPVELRFARVVFGVSSSPFLLNATIRHHLENVTAEPAVVEKLMRAFYVDDVVTGANDEHEAYSFYQISKDILKQGGFNLRKFCSNSVLLQTMINKQENPEPQSTSVTPVLTEADETYASVTLRANNDQRSGERRVLGIRWNISSDEFVMSLEDIASVATHLNPTKRSVVSLVGKFYDPLGFLSPVVIRFKIFLQDLCGVQLHWDDPLTGELLGKWQQLVWSLIECQQIIRIPRCYVNLVQKQLSGYELCGFCDASLKAYAAVVYLRREGETGCNVDFVASKTRVAPLKRQTIPRLELLSALLLARLIASITKALQDEVQVSQFSCFTDSTVALHWILGVDKSWKPFVQNRVSEIRRLLPPELWMHCSGKDNPADLPSRGLTMQELAASELWMNGPAWLKGRLDSSPSPPMPEECLTEMKGLKPETTHGLLTIDESLGIEQIMECENFSSLRRLLSVTSHVLKFCQILLSKVRSTDVSSRDFVEEAEALWIRASQRASCENKNFPQLKIQFGLFRDDNKLWRCGGRLQNANLPLSTIHPILLDRSHHLTVLFIRQAHERVMHGGIKATLTELRSRFWVVKGRSTVQQVLRRCSTCRRYEGQPYQAPPPPPLPPLRVEEAPPFAHTGVDFAGPLYVKSNHSSEKVWICLFTCCVVRAVHLDLVSDLTTPTFLRCFKRFVARRGLPSKVLSDNGKTFEAACKAIHAIISHPDVQTYLTGLGVKWIFNLPRAPWWGGVFERMVKSTKRCLRKTIGQAKLTFDELLTALTEVEAVINSRPLSYVSSEDLEEPLTPSHLLVGRRLMNFPDHLCHEPMDFEAVPDVLTRRARHLNYALTHFWERWRKEYLIELRESHRRYRGNADGKQVSVGDVVVVHDDGQPRGFWRLGRVEELLIGRDGRVRGAVLRVATKGRCSILRRPLQLLYPLEIETPGNPSKEVTMAAQDTPTSNEVEDSEITVSQECGRRPMREAAKRANENRQVWIQELQEEP